MSARSEKCDFPRVTVRRIDLLAPKFRMSRRRRADWSSLGYGSDNRSRGRASPAQVLSKNSINNVNVDTAARDDRARDRRRILSARGNECEIQIGPSVHIVDRELVKQDLEDVHISPEPYPAQSRANTATYILHHDVIQTNADNRMNDPEVSGTPRTRCVRLDTLQRGKPIEKPITTEATTETIPVTPVTKFEKEFEDAKNSNAGQDVERFQSPKVRNFRQEKKNPDSQDVEKTPECLRNTTSQGATKFAQIDKNEKLHKARNENHEGILFLSSAGGDTRIHYAEDDGIFCKRSADHQRNVENIVDKIQVEENRSDRSKLSPGDDISRIADFPRQRENIASRCRQTESSRPHRTNDRHFSHKFNSHNGQDGLNIINEDVQCQSSASGCTDVFQETIFAEDNLDDIDLYRPCLDDLDSILHSNDKKIEHVTRVVRNFSELLSDSKFTIYKLDEDELVPQDAKFCRNSLNDKDGECPLNEAARSSLLETELRNEDLTISKVHQTDDLQAANAAGTKSSAFTKEDGSRSNYSKNSVESSVFPASDANDSPRTSRDSDRTQRSATKAYLLESSMDRSDATTFSNLVPTLSSTHTEAHHQKKEVARDDRDKVTSAKKFSEHKIRRSRKKYTDDRIFAQFFQKDTSQAADRFLAYILQDEKRSIEGKIASALKESAITPAAVQKLLDHLREAESIRDARQSETLDILRNILINVKNQSDQGNANDKKLFFQNVSDSLARSNAPPNAIDESREQSVQQTPVKIDGNEVEQNFAKKSYELKGLGEHSSDLSECRETRESVRSTARCESTQHFANSKDIGQTENADVVRTVSIDKNQTDKDINENNPKKEEIFPRNVTGSLIRSNATSNANEETILRIENNTNDTGQVTEKSNDSKNLDKYFSPAIPESRESVHSVVHFETAKNSKNNSKNNKINNSNENSCSEAESLKQISDIRSDDNENPEENSEHLSTKIASVRSKGGSEMETVDLVTGISVSKNKDDIIIEKLEDGKSQEVVQIDKNQHTNEIVTQADQVIEARSNIPEAVKEITNGITQDNTTSAGKRVLFTLAEVSETKNGRVCSDVSPAKSKFIDKDVTKGDIGLIHLSAKENTGSLREAKIDFQQKMIKQKNADNNCSAESPRDCALPKNSESSSREVASCNKQISFDIAGKDNSTRDMRNEETCKLMTLAVVENRRDGNEISKPQKIATSDNERQLIDLTSISRKYKIDVLSSSNSSVSSTLLDHDDRSTNGALSADTRRAETTPETSHSEGELYMPSSCSYSLGEVRILRRKHDLIENNMMDRDSSMTVLVTKSMLTSLNDSTMSLLGSSERI
ncbi:PREDICTED: uncharacterized protein LOC105150185 isoform X2 [Acromyrmex echinatior]|uniref:uncharacterized protein LOC105150185 isoform X2 n=1 Tax=Acromyrmex echinatior TaxID=103372 RepID=UPI000581003A|nr:PREDICTED: uncharacterized protein LOC105150185 isoform X2 [Acromyrmex echinatior]